MAEVTPELVAKIVSDVISEIQLTSIPIGISNRHIHLSEADFQRLFPGEELRPMKALKQPGEFAAEQTVTIVGSKGEQSRVRILGPFRKNSQVEISMTDTRTLGIPAPVRLSGNLADAAEVTVKNGENQITFKGCIVAKRHIHMSFKDMERFRIQAGDVVKVRIQSDGRSTIFEDVEIRPGETFILEMHVDTDEANAANIKPDTVASLVRE
ncbi:phosphate propanoyltransferase [Enterococcus sp. 669A]|uniref:Phosphate propanoyltransferase n=1 Tax=Candidatus Enterococcus moelleringii TaxID=2815325 RepID=A0ABS3LFI6_9ENTE|nr:phosphate propanoyltransferase [Enterococcus sp. 669A]MBO1308409.1 phosphate propanoyltransferase [Enterococcus sp. 669A]